jgi:hypothetical protein
MQRRRSIGLPLFIGLRFQRRAFLASVHSDADADSIVSIPFPGMLQIGKA